MSISVKPRSAGRDESITVLMQIYAAQQTLLEVIIWSMRALTCTVMISCTMYIFIIIIKPLCTVCCWRTDTISSNLVVELVCVTVIHISSRVKLWGRRTAELISLETINRPSQFRKIKLSWFKIFLNSQKLFLVSIKLRKNLWKFKFILWVTHRIFLSIYFNSF